VTHRNALPHKGECSRRSSTDEVAPTLVIRGLFGTCKVVKVAIRVNTFASFFATRARSRFPIDSYPASAVTASPSRIGCVDD
jgi:hypothetical protein